MTRSAPDTRPLELSERQRHQGRRPRIAIGTDGSEWGDAALDWALRHASLVSANLHVFAGQTSDDQAIARRLRAYRWLHATVTATPESPVHTMLAASMENDLLVLGYRGQQHGPFGLGHWVLPIMTATRCDTVVVRGETRAVHGDHGSVTAAIGGRHDEAVVRRAAQIASRTRSGLRIIHAVPLPAEHHVETAVDPAETLEHAGELVRQQAPGLTPSLLLIRSQPHEAVRTFTRSDLLVIGPGSQPGQLSVVTSTALHMAPCPVLVVKPV
jgi:nucleotide-binding universal stress UspA family protein